jgi:hypothetical protein
VTFTFYLVPCIRRWQQYGECPDQRPLLACLRSSREKKSRQRPPSFLCLHIRMLVYITSISVVGAFKVFTTLKWKSCQLWRPQNHNILFTTLSNNNMANTRMYDVGATVAPLTLYTDVKRDNRSSKYTQHLFRYFM